MDPGMDGQLKKLRALENPDGFAGQHDREFLHFSNRSIVGKG